MGCDTGAGNCGKHGWLILYLERKGIVQTKKAQLAFSLVAFVVIVMPWLLFCNGCQIAGLIAAVGTPTRSERKTVAEYNITEEQEQKILVLVDQPVTLNPGINLRYYLTKAFNEYLKARVKIPAENIVTYDTLSRFRSTRPDFSMLAPSQVGTALAANLVILVIIDDYQLYEMADTGYHKGFLTARALLVDCATGKTLWPELEQTRNIKVGFELEKFGPTAAAARLTAAAAHCTVRYLYDCRKNRFKIAEDRSGVGWTEWR